MSKFWQQFLSNGQTKVDTGSRFWRHFDSNGLAGRVDRRLGLYGLGRRLTIGARLAVPRVWSRGVEVQTITPGGPADHAGILEQDILVTLAARPTTSFSALHQLLGDLPAGVPLRATLVRRGQHLERWVVLDGHAKPASRR